uniref:Uncharacterized protein n=1 Tax=Monopterus albus TaxID=43700 RepID=A0A3Q3KEF1_MONAL
MGKCQVEDLVTVLSHRCTKININARDTIVAVEQLLPQELISGNSQPLSAGQTSSQHSIIGQMQENFQNQAVWQNLATLHTNILGSTRIQYMSMMLYESK